MKKDIIKIGSKFGKLKVLKEVDRKIHPSGRNTRMVECLCDCGNIITTGYLQLKRMTRMCNNCAKKQRPISRTKHGLSKSLFHDIYYGIKRRCNSIKSKDYKDWGGRGIKCEWTNFQTFKDDMYDSYVDHIKKNSKGNTRIDRIDNNGNYCKENCRWATHKEQARNRRSNNLITYNGKTQTLTEWSEELGINRATLSNRINTYKWSIKKSFTKKL